MAYDVKRFSICRLTLCKSFVKCLSRSSAHFLVLFIFLLGFKFFDVNDPLSNVSFATVFHQSMASHLVGIAFHKAEVLNVNDVFSDLVFSVGSKKLLSDPRSSRFSPMFSRT